MTDDRSAPILVVDDEPLARLGVRNLLRAVGATDPIIEASDGEEAVRSITEQRPGLVFLDVQLPRLDGFGVIEAIGADRMPPTVLVTAYDQYALRAFDAQAVDYLLKPIDPQRFRDAFDRASRRAAEGALDELRRGLASLGQLLRSGATVPAPGTPTDDRVRAWHDGRVILLEPKEIDWIESAGNYVLLHTRSGTIRHRSTVSDMALQLGAAFVRIRRSTLIRAGAVRYCEPYGKGSFVVVLYDKTKLTSSRYFRAELTALIGR